MFADSGGSVKYMYVQMRWLIQTLPWRQCEKKPTTSSVLISGRSEKALVSLLHKCAVSPMTIFHMLLQK